MDLSESQSKPANKEEEVEKIEAESKNNNMAAAPPMPPAGAQLTIFYNGSVSVYDAVTSEKAQALMLIAAAASAMSALSFANKVPVTAGANAAAAAAAANGIGAGSAAAAAAALTRSLSQQSSSVAAAAAAAGSPPQHPQVLASPDASSLCKLQADMPIARRQSLTQFLEKRRSRLVSKAPYAPAKKAD